MRLFANLLVTAALIAGLFGAVTAYLPPLRLPDGELIGLTLNAPAGLRPGGPAQPLAAKNAKLTPELLAALRAAGVGRVLVKEFAWSRWTGRWIFLLGCAGLAAGAALKRRQTRRPRVAVPATAEARVESPEAALAALCQAVAGLQAELPGLPDADARFRRTLEVLTDVQERLVPAFVALRSALTARLGLAGYARLMDRFAAAERQLNRAWSAAADEIGGEVTDCLDHGAALLAEAAAELGG